MKKILGFIPSILFFIILMVMSGIGTLIQFQFDITQIIWMTFFISFALRFLTIALSKYIGSDTCYNIEKLKPYVQEPKERFIKLSRAIDYGTFEDWIDKENIQTKIHIFKEKQTKKLNSINAKIRKIKIKNSLNKKKRYDNRIAKLNSQKEYIEFELTDEYINDNIRYLKIWFIKKLKSKDFETESEIANTSRKTYSMNSSYETVKGIIRGVPQILFITLLGSAITYNITVGNINAISFLYDLAMILWYAINGYMGLGKKNIQKLIGVYNDRTEVISKYINSVPTDRSNAFKLLEALKENPS